MSDAPAAALEVPGVGHIAFPAQKQRQLQRLASQPRQVGKLEERHTLRVFIRFVSIHDPIRRIPDGDGGEGFTAGVKPVRPSFQTDGGSNVNPVQTAVGDLAARLAHVFAGGEIEIMVWHA